MRVTWHQRQSYFLAEVEYLLSEETFAAWRSLEARLRTTLAIEPGCDVLSELVKRFTLGQDVRAAHFSGRSLKAEALCPASAWLFNNALSTMIRSETIGPESGISSPTIAVGRFGFQTHPPYSKENGFLQPARCAGFDIIRTSSQVPSYIIRNSEGMKISVLRQFTDRTSVISSQLSTSKFVTSEMLSLAAMPTPKTFMISSAREATQLLKLEKFQSIVIKPNNTDRGLAVYTNLKTDTEISAAFDEARKYGRVILQEHVVGDDFRLLVVDGKVMGVTHRKPFSIIGDGEETIRELLDRKIEWRAAHPFYRHFNDISADTPDIISMLEKQGLNFDSIPELGRTVALRSNANVSTGGEHEEVTEQCHNDIKQLAIDCAALFGLDVAGIDYISSDITKPWAYTKGSICEINPTPALSVDGAPNRLFSRFSSSSDRSASSELLGDVICVRDCSCKTLDELRGRWPDLNFVDMSQFSERQYFFQSYLATRNGLFLLVVTSEMIDRYGVVNSNALTIAYCESCVAKGLKDLNSLPQTPHDVQGVLF